MDHPFRRNRRTFDGKQELECASEVPSGDEILIVRRDGIQR